MSFKGGITYDDAKAMTPWEIAIIGSVLDEKAKTDKDSGFGDALEDML